MRKRIVTRTIRISKKVRMVLAGLCTPARPVRAVPVKAGPHLVAAMFLQRTIVPDGLSPAYLPVGNISFRGMLASFTFFSKPAI